MEITAGSEGIQLPYICVHQDIGVEINEQFLTMTGYKSEDIIGNDILQILNNLLKVNIEIKCIDSLNTIDSCLFFNKLLDFKEARIEVKRSSESDKIYLIFHLLPIISTNNPLSYTYQLISDNLMAAILLSAKDFMVLKANKGYQRITYERYGEADIIGKRVSEFFIGWEESPVKKEWEAAIRNKKTHTVREVKSTNPLTGNVEYHDGSFTPILDEDKVKYLLVCINDVTEKVMYRIQNEKKNKQLKIQRGVLEAVIAKQKDAINILDKYGNIIISNEAARARYGSGELLTIKDIDLSTDFYDEDGRKIRYEEICKEFLLRGEKIDHLKLKMVRGENVRHINLNATPIFNEDGTFDYAFLCGTDITETVIKGRQLLNQKEQLEKVIAMKDDFLALISHEFKTPLTVINSALQTMELLYKNEFSERPRAFLNMIRQNTYRQLRLVNNLLDITKVNAGHMKLNNKNEDIIFVTESLVESVKPYAMQKEVKINFISDLTQKMITFDEEKYERIMLNLLSNAIKFTPRGETIKVKVAVEDQTINIAVIDNGIGISKDKQEMIFERFGQVDSTYARQAEGTGIGLSLVRLLVNKMGGCITVESEIGQGSIFTVKLPDSLKAEDEDEILREFVDSKLIQSMAIEFSDIYF